MKMKMKPNETEAEVLTGISVTDDDSAQEAANVLHRKGIETVYSNAINGINGMPARGTCMDCSDDEVIAAIDYILDNSK